MKQGITAAVRQTPLALATQHGSTQKGGSVRLFPPTENFPPAN